MSTSRPAFKRQGTLLDPAPRVLQGPSRASGTTAVPSGEAVCEWSGVDDDAIDLVVADLVLQPAQVGGIRVGDGGGELHFYRKDLVAVAFDDQVDLGAVAVSEVEQLVVVVAPGSLHR